MDRSERLVVAGIIGILIFCIVMLYKSDKETRESIRESCATYLQSSRTAHDTLQSQIACDQLWAAKSQKDAISAAAFAASAAAGAAAASSVRR